MLKSQKEIGLINNVKQNNSGRLELNSKMPEIPNEFLPMHKYGKPLKETTTEIRTNEKFSRL